MTSLRPAPASTDPAASTGGRIAIAVAGAVLALCWLLPASVSWANDSNLGHAWAVPLLMAYLWWERWAERPPRVDRRSGGAVWWVLGLVLGAADLPLRLLLTPFPMWPVLLGVHAAVFVVLALLSGWLLGGGPGLRWVGGPLILLISALPVPSLVENAIVIPLREVWATLTAEISNLIGLPALAYGTSVRLANAWVGIDEACGGIRSLQACVMMGLFFGEWYRFSIKRRLVLLAAGVASALLGNFARVLFLSLRASAGVEAVERAHDPAGWLAMAASLILTGWLACRWAGYRFPSPRPAPAAAAFAPTSPRGGFPVRWLAVVAALFVLNEAGTRLWFLHGREARLASIPQWTAVLPQQHWSYRATPLLEPARAMLRPDIFRGGSWRSDRGASVSSYYIEWRRGQIARSVPFLHNPTVCLPYAGCELEQTLAPLEVRWAGGTIPFHAYKFRQTGEDILVAFTIWDPSKGRPLVKADDSASWIDWWRTQWAEVSEAREHQPGQLLTVSVPWSEHARELATSILTQIIQPAPGA